MITMNDEWKAWKHKLKLWMIITLLLLIIMFPVGLLAYIIGALYLLADSPD